MTVLLEKNHFQGVVPNGRDSIFLIYGFMLFVYDEQKQMEFFISPDNMLQQNISNLKLCLYIMFY